MFPFLMAGTHPLHDFIRRRAIKEGAKATNRFKAALCNNSRNAWIIMMGKETLRSKHGNSC